MSRGVSAQLYDYGPPVGVAGSGWDNPADTSGAANVAPPGEAPHDPPPDSTIVQEPGGSPTEGSQAPLTLNVETSGLAVRLTFSGPGAYNGSEVLWGDDSPAEYPGPGGTHGAGALLHGYMTAGDYTISVDPLGEMFQPTTIEVTVAAEEEPTEEE